MLDYVWCTGLQRRRRHGHRRSMSEHRRPCSRAGTLPVLQSILEVGAFRLDLIIYDLSRPRCDSFGVCVQDFSQEKALDRSWLREPTGRNVNERIDHRTAAIPGRGPSEYPKRVGVFLQGRVGPLFANLIFASTIFCIYSSSPPSLSPCASVHADRALSPLYLHAHAIHDAINPHSATHMHTYNMHSAAECVLDPHPLHLHTATRGFRRASSCSQPPTTISDELPMSDQPLVGL